MNKLKTAFFGTPEFSVSSLEALNSLPKIDLRAVITMPDRRSGRGKKLQPPPVAVYAKEKRLPLFQTANINKDLEIIQELEKMDLDLIIVIAFSQFLSKKILSLPKSGCFNIHTSLLPKYRGAAPIQYALLNGDQETGVCIQKMVSKMDAGDIVYQKNIPIKQEDTADVLFKKLEISAAIGLKEFIDNFSANNITFTPQDEELVSYAPIIQKSDGAIDFAKEDSITIINKFRAYYPWPGIHFFINGQRIKVHQLENSDAKLAPKEIDKKSGTLTIGCAKGALYFSKVQLDGKAPCHDHDLLNGFKNKYSTLEVTDA